DIAHVQGAEIDTEVMQVGDELCQPGEQLQLIQAGVVTQQLTQRLAGQGLIMDNRAVGGAQPIQLNDPGAGYAKTLELRSIVRKTFGRRIERGFRQPALAPEQLEKGAVGQAQNLFAVTVFLQHLCVTAPSVVLPSAE